MPRRATRAANRTGPARSALVATFVKHLFESNLNASEAVRRTEAELGSTASKRENATRARAYDLMHDPAVIAALEAHADAATMSAREVLIHLSTIARSTMDDFLTEECEIDLARAKERGAIHALKSFTVDETPVKVGDEIEMKVRTRIELHDRLKALSLLAKHHHLLADSRAKDDLPKDERELDDFIVKHYCRAKGIEPPAGGAAALRAMAGLTKES